MWQKLRKFLQHPDEADTFVRNYVEIEKFSAKSRYVAVCDILSFRSIVQNHNVTDVAKSYLGLLNSAISVSRGKSRLRCAVFSDTILAWSDASDSSDFPESSYSFFFLLGTLFLLGLRRQLPLRIGVAYGDCVISPVSNIFVGNPIVDAYLTEQAQDWIGIGCHPSCLEAPANKYIRDSDFSPLIAYDVPLKQNAVLGGLSWSVNWPANMLLMGDESQIGGMRRFLRSLCERFDNTPHGIRWKRTLDFFEANKLFKNY